MDAKCSNKFNLVGCLFPKFAHSLTSSSWPNNSNNEITILQHDDLRKSSLFYVFLNRSNVVPSEIMGVMQTIWWVRLKLLGEMTIEMLKVPSCETPLASRGVLFGQLVNSRRLLSSGVAIPKGVGWVRKVGLPQPLRGRGLGREALPHSPI